MEEGTMGLCEAQGDDSDIKYIATRRLSSTQLFSMCLAVVVESMNITIAYTIGVYMVRNLLQGADQSKIATLTGLLSSFYSLGQLTTAFAWGTLSDMYGRKRFILMSNLVSTLSMLWFGLSPSYTSAAAARLVGGLFNCSFTNVRSMIGESTDFTSQALAFGYLGLAFGVGTVLGPLVGGALSMPCENVGPRFPLCGKGHLNAVRPFFLPCLVTAMVSAVAVASNIFLMSETLPRIVEARKAKQVEQQGDAAVPLLDDLTPGDIAPDIEGGVPQDSPTVQQPISIGSQSAPGSSMPVGSSPADRLPRSFRAKNMATSSPDDVPWLQLGTPFLLTSTVSANVADDMAEFEADNPGRWTEERFRSRSSGFFRRVTLDAAMSSLAAADVGADVLEDFESRGGGGGRHLHAQPPRRAAPTHVSLLSRTIPRSVFADSQDGGASAPHGAQQPELEGIEEEQGPKDAAENGQGSKPAEGEPEKPWYRDPLVLLSCSGYMMICFMFNMLDELFPIFAAAPIATGGLSFSSADLSLPLSVSGAALMVWSLFIFPPVQMALGAWLCAVTGLAVTVVLAVALGCTSFLAEAGLSHGAVLGALLVVMILKVCAQQMCFPTSMAIVNRFAPAAYRGAVNGAAQSMASAVRALGPFLGGVMWAVFSGMNVPGHQIFPFIIISATSALTILLYRFLPRM